MRDSHSDHEMVAQCAAATEAQIKASVLQAEGINAIALTGGSSWTGGIGLAEGPSNYPVLVPTGDADRARLILAEHDDSSFAGDESSSDSDTAGQHTHRRPPPLIWLGFVLATAIVVGSLIGFVVSLF